MSHAAFTPWEVPATATNVPTTDAYFQGNTLRWNVGAKLDFAYFAYVVSVTARSGSILEFKFIDCNTKKVIEPSNGQPWKLDLMNLGAVHSASPSTLPADTNEAAKTPISLLFLNTSVNSPLDPAIRTAALATNADETGQGKWPRTASVASPSDKQLINDLMIQLGRFEEKIDDLKKQILILEETNRRLRLAPPSPPPLS